MNAAKRQAENDPESAERLRVSDPEKLAAFIIKTARLQFQEGEKTLEFEISLISDNFVDWFHRHEDPPYETLTGRERIMMHNSVARLAKTLVSARLAEGTYIPDLIPHSHSEDIVTFEVKINVVKI